MRTQRERLEQMCGDLSPRDMETLILLAQGLLWSAETHACLAGIADRLRQHWQSLGCQYEDEEETP